MSLSVLVSRRVRHVRDRLSRLGLVINALRQAGDAEIARLTTAHRELAGDGLEIVREAIIETDRVAVIEAEIARVDNELEDWRATYRPKSALVKELEQAESRVSALKAENAHHTDEAVNEVWEDVLRCAQQAWPEKQSYCDSPLELVTRIIDERDELTSRVEHTEAALADRDAQVIEACAGYLDRNYGGEAAEAVAALRTQAWGPILTGPEPVQGHRPCAFWVANTCFCASDCFLKKKLPEAELERLKGLQTWMESSLQALREKQAENESLEGTASNNVLAGRHGVAAEVCRMCADDIQSALSPQKGSQ